MKVKNTTAATQGKNGHPGVYVPGRRGRPPKNKKKFLQRFLSEPEPGEVEVKGFIKAEQLCDFCQQPSTQNQKGRFEALLFCKDCTAKAHPSCMDYSEELSFRARKGGTWQCIDCKTCGVCHDTCEPDMMLFCDGCDKGYHMYCHKPAVAEKPSGKWVCTECTSDGVTAEELEKREKEWQAEKEREREQQRQMADNLPDNLLPVAPINVKQESGSTLPPTPAESPTPADEAGRRPRFEPFDPGAGRKLLSKEPYLTPDGVYPDATTWSIDDVAKFFISVGFPDQAEVFREQEIDGRSLLLLKRSDIITGMSLKLGPALKIYRHVQKLQVAGMSFKD